MSAGCYFGGASRQQQIVIIKEYSGGGGIGSGMIQCVDVGSGSQMSAAVFACEV
jgi:hypothetical protein